MDTHNKIVSFIWGIADDVLRDTEQVPLLEEGGIEAFIRREVLLVGLLKSVTA